VERTADLACAVKQIVDGKAFDYGTVCSSEQALVAEASLREPIIAELKKNGAYFCTPEEKQSLARTLLKENYRINPECVGQSPQRIGALAGFTVPAEARIIVAETEGVGKAHPLSVEKLSPVLALLFVPDHATALDTCQNLLRFGGKGHTAVIYSKDDARVREFGLRQPAMRVLVNTSAPQGSTGITTNVFPSMTLGCGAMAGNITSDNVGPQHLINVKRIAWKVRSADEALKIPAEWQNISGARPAPAAVDRDTITSMVERYLAERGVKVSGAAPVRSAAPASIAAEIVDRFLGSQRRGSPPPSCPGNCPSRQPQPPSETPEPPAPPPPAPKVEISPFVCENDVRMAMQRSAKIYIGPKSIVTPAARDLGEQHGILVLTQP
jgi:hypothetical protein